MNVISDDTPLLPFKILEQMPIISRFGQILAPYFTWTYKSTNKETRLEQPVAIYKPNDFMDFEK